MSYNPMEPATISPIQTPYLSPYATKKNIFSFAPYKTVLFSYCGQGSKFLI